MLAQILLIVALLSFSAQNGQQRLDTTRHLRDDELAALAEAVADEIYDYRREKYFYDMTSKGAGRRQITLHVRPTVEGEVGWVIYKLMPDGEVIRRFSFAEDGLAVLYGDPENGFPPSQPDYLTVYIDDDQLCEMKRISLKRALVIDLEPSQGRLEQAARNQERRVGYSLRNHDGAKRRSGAGKPPSKH